MKKIAIIGAGWFGLYIGQYLLDKGHDVIVYEKNCDIFQGASFYNQCRVHRGYHYCRDHQTRNMCNSTYEKFITEFKNCVKKLDNNYYCISNESLVDEVTYENIFIHDQIRSYKKKNIENFPRLQNINTILDVDEMFLDPVLAKNFFKNKNIYARINFNTHIENHQINPSHHDPKKVEINNVIYDHVIICTYGKNNFFKNDKYFEENTMSLIFEKKNPKTEGITIVDGPFQSMYPFNIEQKLYTLTDVVHTPCTDEMSEKDIELKIYSIIERFKHYYPDFLYEYNYKSYFFSRKFKKHNVCNRHVIVSSNDYNNIIEIISGKIQCIYDAASQIDNLITF